MRNCEFLTPPRACAPFSYTTLSNVRMTLNGRSVVLRGLWDDTRTRVSQSSVATFQVQRSEFQELRGDSSFAGLIGFSVLPFSKHAVEFSLLSPGKFKLIGVSSC